MQAPTAEFAGHKESQWDLSRQEPDSAEGKGGVHLGTELAQDVEGRKHADSLWCGMESLGNIPLKAEDPVHSPAVSTLS